MNTESCAMRRVDRDWKSWDESSRPQPGDFQIFQFNDRHQITMVLPDGGLCRIPIERGTKSSDSWMWDGNEDLPTLHPSVFQFAGQGAERVDLWHGWIRAGRMESC